MTSPAGAQNKEIDCLSPEAQRLVRGRRGSDLCLPAAAAELGAPTALLIKGSGPFSRGGPAVAEAGGPSESHSKIPM